MEDTKAYRIPSPSPKGDSNKIKMIYAFPVAIIMLLLAVAFAMRGGKTDTQQLLGENTAPTSLKALMALGIPQQCSFNVKNDTANGANESTGTVYLSGNKMRVDTETHVMMSEKDTLMTSHMISDGTYYYMWSDEDKAHGIKMAMTEMMKNGETQNQQKPPVDPDTAMDYHCSPGLPDASKLETPKDVAFMDMSDMVNGMMKNMPGGMPKTGTTVKGGTGDAYPAGSGSAQMKAMQCSACEQAGDQKAACLKALSC